MSEKRVYIYDSTLRDGAQTKGVDFSQADKLAIAAELDQIGICLLYTSPSPRDLSTSRMPSSA